MIFIFKCGYTFLIGFIMNISMFPHSLVVLKKISSFGQIQISLLCRGLLQLPAQETLDHHVPKAHLVIADPAKQESAVKTPLSLNQQLSECYTLKFKTLVLFSQLSLWHLRGKLKSTRFFLFFSFDWFKRSCYTIFLLLFYREWVDVSQW